jgi:hypothetical protein
MPTNNLFMEKYTRFFFFFLLTGCLVVSGCQPPVGKPEALIQTPIFPSIESTDSTPTLIPDFEPTEVHGELLFADDFEGDSPFCLAEPDSSAFTSSCLNNELTLSQSQIRRKLDILFAREVSIQSGAFSFEIEVLSEASKEAKSDQNIYGIYFIDESGQYHVLRLMAQYFDFETWSINEGMKVEEKTNLVFTPLISSSGKSNSLMLNCSEYGCDFFANGHLAGRSSIGITGNVKAIGLIALSEWDQQFGQVKFKDLQIYTLPEDKINSELYILEDSLTSGSEIFAGTGLSGAFRQYDSDGFHFSPVIPYGYYGVKGGPGLSDMSVSATVRMEITPGVSSSQYAGLVCRSSQDGMIIAIIRADGSYTIYRDTPQRPFAVLAQKSSDAILPGIAENKLQLDCIGNQIDFYINKAKVESLTDTRYGLRYGRAGLFTKAGGAPDPDAVIFSNFSVTEIR